MLVISQQISQWIRERVLDGGVDILPLGGLFKTEVKEVAREMGFTEDINVRTLAKNMARPDFFP